MEPLIDCIASTVTDDKKLVAMVYATQSMRFHKTNERAESTSIANIIVVSLQSP